MPENGTYSARASWNPSGETITVPPATARLFSRPTHAIVWISAVLFVVACNLFGIYALEQRRLVERDAVTTAQNLALLLSEHTKRFLDASHLVTSMAMTQAVGHAWDAVRRSHESHEFLRRLPENFHFVEAVGLVDEEGDLVLTSRSFPAPARNLAKREHFQIQQQTDAGSFLSRLSTSETTGQPSIYLSRRINDGAGRFRGIATAVINPQSFYSFYASLRPELPIVVDVFRADLAIVLRYPPTPEAYGQKWGGRDNLAAQPYGGVLLDVEHDGRRRTEAFAKVGETPVYVSVGLNNADIRKAWRAALVPGAALGGAAFLLMAFVLGMALFLARRYEAAGAAIHALAGNLEDRVRERTRDLERASRELERHAEDKEAQTREMNHRVKNSLQLVGALLRLQGKAAEDAAVEEQLEEASNRVATVAQVHDKLYRSADLRHIAGDEYLRAICGDLQRTLAGVDTDVRFTLALDPIRLSADKAILIGLVVSELVSSAAKHAFLPGQKGIVNIVMQQTESGLRLVIGDNGERAPDLTNTARNFSGTVVTSLIEQLEGKAEYHSGPDGNSVVIALPLSGA